MSPEAKQSLEKVREISLALPRATEKVSHGQPVFYIEKGKTFPIFITHTKPAETDLIMAEIQRFDQTQPFGPNVTHDIRWLRAGQEFDL